MALSLQLGVKSDPIECRYSFEWLFDLMAGEEVHILQLGTFFEIYQLPDDFFLRLREKADRHSIAIRSVFTSHRELGGFFQQDPAFHEIAHQNYRRLIEIGALVGAESVGCNPGATLRDRMAGKPEGVRTYLAEMKRLMHEAKDRGIGCLTMEPMSCLAEPPTLPDEIVAFASELDAYHQENLSTTARIGYCADISHGYANSDGEIVHTNLDLLKAGLPWTWEFHLRNTDGIYSSTVGFSESDLDRGIVDVAEIRRFLLAHQRCLPTQDVVGYLEIPGPKLGRDYSDKDLERSLRESLRHLKRNWLQGSPSRASHSVKRAPSIMCADMAQLAVEVRKLESLGVDMIHVDIMDAHFVPNMPLGIGAVERLRELTKLPLDIHLMVANNEFFIDRFAKIGVDRISFHAESASHLNRTLRLIKSHGIQAGVALCPATPLTNLDYAIDEIDFLLLMTVDPGFAGQPLVKGALRKISDARRWIGKRNIPIEVDGNVSLENIPKMVAAGADELVLGSSSLFQSGRSYRSNMADVDSAILEGLKG